MNSKPVIGILSAIVTDKRDWKFYGSYTANSQAIQRAGGLSVIIPSPMDADDLQQISQRIDGVLIPGGVDIDPATYRAERHPLTVETFRARDETEVALTRWAVENEAPVFGICRGNQLFNVAMGGTLIQDISVQHGTQIIHNYQYIHRLPASDFAHEVRLVEGSRLHEILGKTTIQVNSLHHQAVERPGDSLQVTAYAPDGIIEGLEIPEHPFALSVQWHPEYMPEDENAQALFRAFVEAAREYMQRKVPVGTV
jgi:putative glutamine amidotransferase